MDSQAQILRITIDQLAKLVRQLAQTKEDADDRPRWVMNPSNGMAISNVNVTRFLPVNYFRRGLLLNSPTGIQVFVGSDASIVANKGISLTTNQPLLELYYNDIGAAVCREWWALAAAAGGNLCWIEIIAPSQIV